MVGSLLDIRLFVAAYESRSFTGAARRENATQSGVSQHIRKLEGRFGVSLFTRDKGRVAPTPAGDVYYRACLDVLRAHDAATLAVRACAGGLEGEVSVGLMPTMTRCVLAPALARFVDTHPNAAIRVVEGYSAPLTGLVQSGDLDFAVVPGTAGIAGVRSRLILRTPEVLVAALRPDTRHRSAPVRPSELGRLRLVVPSRINTRRLSIESYLASNAVAVERMIEVDAMFGTLDLIGRSDWVSILPAIMMASEPEPERFAINPLVSPTLVLDLVLIEPARKTLSPVAAAFLALLEEEAIRINERWTDVLA